MSSNKASTIDKAQEKQPDNKTPKDQKGSKVKDEKAAASK
jgi:hypothetical protein